jgi:hypothetical protein
MYARGFCLFGVFTENLAAPFPGVLGFIAVIEDALSFFGGRNALAITLQTTL